MKHCIVFFFLLSGFSQLLFGQCDLEFGSGASPLQFGFATQSGSDIVNGQSSGAFETSTQSFDIFDETTNDCSTGGGTDDVTFLFEMVHTFDQYGVDGVIDQFAGSTHDITQSSSGLRGNIPLGSSGTNETSTGDVRGYKITVTFANHVNIFAQDLTVNFTSVNTAGSAHESCALVFLDESGAAYGTATYDGYYTGTTGASTNGSCTAPAVRANSWSTSATGAFTASSTSTVTTSPDACTATNGTSGPNNNHNVDPVLDAGLNATDKIGGFVFTVYLEDIAASSAPGAPTSTSTSLISTLNGINIASVVLPVELLSFDAKEKSGQVQLDWTTASEKDNNYFDIQWSADGRNFESVGKVNGTGNIFETTKYSFTHPNPAKGENYYRLKQVDFNGRFSMSEMRSVAIETENAVSIFPNVVTHTLNIVIAEPVKEIAIYNTNGVLVQRIDQQDEGRLEVNTANLVPGNYFVTFTSHQQKYASRFIKM